MYYYYYYVFKMFFFFLQDKPFPNLATLMKYFTKSQEKDIQMQPVFCKEQGIITLLLPIISAFVHYMYVYVHVINLYL